MQTKWCVISGGPSSGKTTLIDELDKLGYNTIEEVPRRIISEEKAKGFERTQKGQDKLIQKKIIDERIRVVKETPSDVLTFFDTDFTTSFPYAKKVETGTKEIIEYTNMFKPMMIFHLEQLDFFEEDGLRIEDAESAAQIGKEQKELYGHMGLKYISVPPMSVQERIAFILEKLKHQ